jgi:L-ascorbate metabolism protein UlaG (beta-lactamase superfamily)
MEYRNMTRYLVAAAGALLLAGTVTAADPAGKVEIRWYGNSFFDITSSKGTHLITDPHAIPAFGSREVKADIVLISHEHSDHNQLGILNISDPKNVIHGLKLDKKKKLDWDPIDTTIKEFHIRSVKSYHDNEEGLVRGKNTIFVIEVDGLRIVHLGDLGHLLSDKQVKEIGKVDVLMIPVGGVYTINGDEAKKVMEQLKPRLYVLPMHYGTESFDDLLSEKEFVEDQKNVDRPPSNSLTVDANFKPTEPTIVILKAKEK